MAEWYLCTTVDYWGWGESLQIMWQGHSKTKAGGLIMENMLLCVRVCSVHGKSDLLLYILVNSIIY